MVEVFRTDIYAKTEAQAMIAMLSGIVPEAVITFDLEDCDKVLRIESPILEVSNVISLMQVHGYVCEILP